MALQDNDLAILTARFGCARFGASRFGFIPCRDDVHGPGADEPGEYIWKEVKPPTTTWTLLTENCICGQTEPSPPVASFIMSQIFTANFMSVPNRLSGDTTTNFDFYPSTTPTYIYYGSIAFHWDFGDGTAHSILQYPTHNFSAAGTYTVTLTITVTQAAQTSTDSVSYDYVVAEA